MYGSKGWESQWLYHQYCHTGSFWPEYHYHSGKQSKLYSWHDQGYRIMQYLGYQYWCILLICSNGLAFSLEEMSISLKVSPVWPMPRQPMRFRISGKAPMPISDWKWSIRWILDRIHCLSVNRPSCLYFLISHPQPMTTTRTVSSQNHSLLVCLGKERLSGDVPYAAMIGREKNCRMISSVRYANIQRRILRRLQSNETLRRKRIC